MNRFPVANRPTLRRPTYRPLIVLVFPRAAADGSGGSSDEDAASGSSVTEVRFVPGDGGALDAMFQAMSECQSLHPDPEDSVSADGEYAEY